MLHTCTILAILLCSAVTPVQEQASIDAFAGSSIWQQVQSNGDGLAVVSPDGTISLYYDVNGTSPVRRQVIRLVPQDPGATLGLGISSYTGRIVINSEGELGSDKQEFRLRVLLTTALDGAGLDFVWQMTDTPSTGDALVIVGQCVELAAWHDDDAFAQELTTKCGVQLADAQRTWPLLMGAADLVIMAAAPKEAESACMDCSAGGKGSSSCSITEHGSTRSVSCKSGRYACCKVMDDGALSAKCCQDNGKLEANSKDAGPADDIDALTGRDGAI
ncbi:MAG: hypothetical protein JXO22_02125, partial [Phycisphaerae bacterium]|nr:hypothetical protein [Phycisphaerae bacterium]